MSASAIVAARRIAPQECVPEWDQSSTTVLIHMYRERKCLWDSSHEFYKNRRFRREALAEIASHFNCCLADVEKKLYMLRSSFRKEYRRWDSAKLNAGPNGADLVRKPQWFALDLLMFLKDDIASKSPTPTNLARGSDDNSPQQLDDSGLLQKEIQSIFYYNSENSTLTPLDVSLERNSQQLQSHDKKRTVDDSSKRSLEEDFLESSSKRQKMNGVANDSGISRAMKTSTSKLATEKDSSVAFGNFVAEELKNIKDHEQMQLARLRIHQILFDGARGLLKMPIPRL